MTPKRPPRGYRDRDVAHTDATAGGIVMGLGTLLAASSGASGVLIVVYILVLVLELASFWRIFTKAGQPGWAVIIPFYNYYVMLKIVGRPGWWLILFFIPFVNFIAAIVVLNDLSKSFGHGGGFTVGLLFLPFIFGPILGFGSDRYLGPAGGGPGYASGGQATGAVVTGYGQGSWGGPEPSSSGGFGYDAGFSPSPGGGSVSGIPTPTQSSVAPTTTPANWYADPTARHELRYWDGTAWTEHVSDNGAQATDPV